MVDTSNVQKQLASVQCYDDAQHLTVQIQYSEYFSSEVRGSKGHSQSPAYCNFSKNARLAIEWLCVVVLPVL